MTYRLHESERKSHAVNRSEFIRHLAQVLPAESIISQQEALKPYECDGLSAYQQVPWLVVLPDSIEQIQSIMELCYANNIPVVARGAGTGLSGGALPLENGVLLSLARLNRILEIDAVNRTACVQPGVRNASISQQSSRYGLFYAPDPSSQIACTIGGNVAENSGGVHCLKYGLTVHNVLKLKIVTMQGQLVIIGGNALDSAGFDLLAVMTGSEGMLGIVVEVTVKLTPKPDSVCLIQAAFDSIQQASEAVAAIMASGVTPAGLEMMDNASIRAAEQFVHAGYPVDAEAILLCELDGHSSAVVEETGRIQSILKQFKASQVVKADDSEQQQKIWSGRKAAFPAIGQISPDYYCMDGTIPRHQLSTVLEQIQQLSEHYGLAVANVFHAGDGNLHPLILYDANQSGELERAEQLGSDILMCCIESGGTITGEHGVGVEKINAMCAQFSDSEIQQFHRVKSAFDPDGLLNPGKAIPTLNRCAEFGAMHSHQARTHTELERF
ncbi:MAG: FAD-binding protein [Gammaproteobacteria bacterium]|nr:FAD-binding protein [Gammaproteobacteria bacterium]